MTKQHAEEKEVALYTDQLPAELAEHTGPTGLEGLDQGDFTYPFLKLAQVGTPQVKNKDDRIMGLEPGMFFSSLSGTIFGMELKIVILKIVPTYTEWGSDKLGDFRRAYSPSEFRQLAGVKEGPEGKGWVTASGTKITFGYNIFVLLPDFPEEGILVHTLTATGIKHAKRINTTLELQRLPSGAPAPTYAKVWKVIPGTEVSPKGEFYTWGSKGHTNFTALGYCSAELFARAKEAAQLLASLDMNKVAAEPEQGELFT